MDLFWINSRRPLIWMWIVVVAVVTWNGKQQALSSEPRAANGDVDHSQDLMHIKAALSDWMTSIESIHITIDGGGRLIPIHVDVIEETKAEARLGKANCTGTFVKVDGPKIEETEYGDPQDGYCTRRYTYNASVRCEESKPKESIEATIQISGLEERGTRRRNDCCWRDLGQQN